MTAEIERPRRPPGGRDPSVGAGASLLLAFVLLHGAWRSSDLDRLAVDALPGITAWLFLAALAATPRRDPTAGAAAGAPVVVAVAVVHALAWWSDVDALRLIASLAMAVAGGWYLVARVSLRPGAIPLDVAQLGAIVASVLLLATLTLEVFASLTDGSPDLLDARRPGLGALAVLTGTALAEPGLRRPRSPATDRAGTFQMLLFGASWMALVGGIGLDDLALQATAVALQVIAVAVFLVRLTPELLPAAADRFEARWSAVALMAAATYVGLLVQIVAGFADGRYADAASFPRWLETAVDVAAFVGLAGGGTLRLATAGRTVRVTRPWRFESAATVAYALGALGIVGASVAATTVGARVAWVLTAAIVVVVAWRVRSSDPGGAASSQLV